MTPARRLPFVDVARGVAVVLMIFTHAHGAWLAPEARAGAGYAVSSVLYALPSRLFLLLYGVSFALGLSRGGGDAGAARRATLVRSLELLALAMALRLHDWLGHGGGDPVRLWKVDILACMGASGLLLIVCVGADGLPRPGRALGLGALVFFAALPLAGRAGPAAIPAPLWSYLAGPRPMAWFPLLPWAAYALAGVALGAWFHADVRMRFPAAIGVGALALGLALGRLQLPARLGEAEAGPGDVLVAGGAALLVIALSGAVTWPPRLAGVLGALGRASLPIYFVHLALVYGRASAPLHGRLGLGAATLGALVVSAAMLAVAWAWARRPRRRGRAPAPR